MKYTNIKKLLIKFMGGGLVNFPIRFLKWVKIDGDAKGDDSDSGSDNSNNIFFKLATIQPNGYSVFPLDDKIFVINDIENLNLNTLTNYAINDKIIEFYYSKEEIAKLGFSLERLEALESYTGNIDDLDENHAISVDSSILRDNFIINSLSPGVTDEEIPSVEINKIFYNSNNVYFIVKYTYENNNYYNIVYHSA